jgi:hypothetical protein
MSYINGRHGEAFAGIYMKNDGGTLDDGVIEGGTAGGTANGAAGGTASGTDGKSKYEWFISADKIFSCEVEEFKEFSRFYGMEFEIYKFSTPEGEKTYDTSVCAKNVKVYIPNGSHCANIQNCLAQGKAIETITLRKVATISNKKQILEEKKFSNCFLQAFKRKEEVASFLFRYSSYKDEYTDFEEDGTKKGTAAVSVDLIKWEIGG